MLVVSPSAFSKGKKKKEAAPTETLTPTPTPTPEVHAWNFDQDKAGAVPAGWKALEGDWQVIADPTAPSKPNTFGLPAGRLIKSLTSALERRLGLKVRLHCDTDPDLIGGAILRSGDLVIDGSLRTRLNRIAYELTA